MSDQHLPSHWIEKLCAILSIEGWRNGVFPPQIVRFFSAWARAEGGTAQWNPLNTTEHAHSTDFGDWQKTPDYNKIGVANFKTQALGIMATAVTLLSPRFNALLVALRGAETSGVSAEQLVTQYQSEIAAWGTDTALMLQLLKEIKSGYGEESYGEGTYESESGA